MIKILFPQGCYGTYFSRCLYQYSNLKEEEFIPLAFDSTGSSHVHRNNRHAISKIIQGHFPTLPMNTTDTIISLIPDNNCNLDYFNNQFYKQAQSQIIEFILSMYNNDEIETKLKKNWNYHKALDLEIPNWILREWCSFWLSATWQNSYSRELYGNSAFYKIEVVDLLNNIEQTLTQSFDYLNLTFTVDMSIIKNTHATFLSVQKFHGIQQRCNRWADAVLTDTEMESPVQTIFDEAYLQYLFKDKGYEIFCNGLNIFPTSSRDMKKIIYKQ